MDTLSTITAPHMHICALCTAYTCMLGLRRGDLAFPHSAQLGVFALELRTLVLVLQSHASGVGLGRVPGGCEGAMYVRGWE